jgi:hypothetical protein
MNSLIRLAEGGIITMLRNLGQRQFADGKIGKLHVGRVEGVLGDRNSTALPSFRRQSSEFTRTMALRTTHTGHGLLPCGQ